MGLVGVKGSVEEEEGLLFVILGGTLEHSLHFRAAGFRLTHLPADISLGAQLELQSIILYCYASLSACLRNTMADVSRVSMLERGRFPRSFLLPDVLSCVGSAQHLHSALRNIE